jgi:FkbM family methyltransferase
MLAGLQSQLRVAGRLAMPVGLAEALEARQTFRARGWETPSLRLCRQAMISRIHILPFGVDPAAGIVLDVGANEGSFTNAIKALVPAAQVVAVEPAPGPRAQLQQRFAATPGVTVVGKAVGEAPGTATFHLTAHSHNSSLQVPHQGMEMLYDDAGWQVVESVEVPVTTLDELADGRDVSVLKLDVQGGELPVLRGGREALARTTAILIEVTFVSHYENDATFGTLHAELVGQGFELIAMSETGRTLKGVPTWGDACYIRPERIPA